MYKPGDSIVPHLVFTRRATRATDYIRMKPCAPPAAKRARLLSVYKLSTTKAILGDDALAALDLEATICALPFKEGLPGGFLTNTPKRGVYAAGDGTGFNVVDGELVAMGGTLGETAWTAAIKHPTSTAVGEPAPLPGAMARFGVACRRLLQDWRPEVAVDPWMFSIGVCNQYTDPSHYIAAHTDGNPWYRVPYFVSVTFYPDGEPVDDAHFARFQIRPGGKGAPWETVVLRHGSALLMSGDIEHRVMKHLKGVSFKRRINVTMRTAWSPSVSPVLHYMCVANHTRYYGRTKRLVLSADEEDADKLTAAYGTSVPVERRPLTSAETWAKRRDAIRTYRAAHPHPFKATHNLVLEAFTALNLK